MNIFTFIAVMIIAIQTGVLYNNYEEKNIIDSEVKDSLIEVCNYFGEIKGTTVSMNKERKICKVSDGFTTAHVTSDNIHHQYRFITDLRHNVTVSKGMSECVKRKSCSSSVLSSYGTSRCLSACATETGYRE